MLSIQKTETFYIFLVPQSLTLVCVLSTYSASQFGPATSQVLSCHMWPVATRIGLCHSRALEGWTNISTVLYNPCMMFSWPKKVSLGKGHALEGQLVSLGVKSEAALGMFTWATKEPWEYLRHLEIIPKKSFFMTPWNHECMSRVLLKVGLQGPLVRGFWCQCEDCLPRTGDMCTWGSQCL